MINNNKYLEIVTKYRRDLHKIPEIAFDLYLTHDYIINELKQLGFKYEVVASTGIVVYIKGKSSEIVAFRSDMDALNVKEETNVDFVSNHHGKMHACGHDGHMAMLLGFARYLKEDIGLNNLNKSILLIFQPAEEGPGGAVEIIKSGIFEKYNIKAIFGIHLDPSLEEGKYGLRSGALMSQNAEFDIEILGTSAHGAQPHLGSDAIVATSNLISSYQTIISRNLNPLNPTVITFGNINGGEARNIIAKKVVVNGTLRTFSEVDYEYVKQRMIQINESIEKMYNVKVNANIMDYYKAVINDEELVNLTISNLNKEDYKIINPLMVSEDFSFYQRVVRGLFVMLGVRNEGLGYTNPLHSACFNFKEEVLLKGIELYILESKIHNVF